MNKPHWTLTTNEINVTTNNEKRGLWHYGDGGFRHQILDESHDFFHMSWTEFKAVASEAVKKYRGKN